ncbi:hypothetical protein SCLCIDRAFT_1222321 [Scleroderma citrinum Foug A]|uniref:Uncharacterized protein n=1 Tax=Scleroderma citrinum Foug A TaxID=1036808 RepID=A0A0C2YWN2_9AGAM|nr:hypothetical protein SCLCIDRAFT_1222321 [Scleroderma citrinum Foug A]
MAHWYLTDKINVSVAKSVQQKWMLSGASIIVKWRLTCYRCIRTHSICVPGIRHLY